MAVLRFDKRVGALPDPLTPDTVYFQRTGAGIDIRVSDSTGAVAHGLNAPAKTAATLTHTAGAVTLDVQAADLYRFEADEYSMAGTPSYIDGGQATTNSSDIVINFGANVADMDTVFVLACEMTFDTVTTPAGWTKTVLATFTTVVAALYRRVWRTGDPTSVTLTDGGSLRMAAIWNIWRGSAASLGDTTSLASSRGTSALSSTGVDSRLLWALVAGDSIAMSKDTSVSTGFTSRGDAEKADGLPFLTAQLVSRDTLTAGSGSVSGPDFNNFSPEPSSWQYGGGTVGIELLPAEASGERDYTFTFSNIPTDGIATGLIDIELKTDTGSVAFAGGTVTWIGATPAFDAVGRYLIGFAADSTGITLWREA